MVLAIGKCASLTSLLLVLLAMSTLVRSQAPGDAMGQSCIKPAVPDGVFMLLDAGWYPTLLTGRTDSAGWTQTPAGSVSEFMMACRHVVHEYVCIYLCSRYSGREGEVIALEGSRAAAMLVTLGSSRSTSIKALS